MLAGRTNPGRKAPLVRVSRMLPASSDSCAQRAISAKRGASTMESAVPQLPAPMMASFAAKLISTLSGRPCLLRPPESEHVFVTSAYSLDVRLMTNHDERARNQCGYDDRRRRMQNQPDCEREGPAGDDRPQRNVASSRHDNYKDEKNRE